MTAHDPARTAIEQRWHQVAPPLAVDSARALYAWMPRQRSGALPFVDDPYQHGAPVAREALRDRETDGPGADDHDLGVQVPR